MEQKLFKSPPPKFLADVRPRSAYKLRVSHKAQRVIAKFASQLLNQGVISVNYFFNPADSSLTFEDDVAKVWVTNNIGGESGNLPVDQLELVATHIRGEQYCIETIAENQEELARLNELGPNDNLSN